MDRFSILFLIATVVTVVSGIRDDFLRLPSENVEGTRWAVLVAGSKDYYNYRHQADVCHAYQILKKGGLKDENIIVFMYDDIAYNESNPHPGVIINHPLGSDVYKGVPKDYVGEDINPHNFYAVLLANKSALTGTGSGKVLDSGPNDHVFIYYTDHGGAGVLGMPSKPYIFASDLNDALKKKHASGTYKSLVFYVESCEAGSMFDGLLPEDHNIYVMAASDTGESSWVTYCPFQDPRLPPEYDVCIGDLFSVSWLEDSDVHNLRTETIHQQCEVVKKKTIEPLIRDGTHIVQFGDTGLSNQSLFVYMGTDPANDNNTFVDKHSLVPPRKAVSQRDADLIHFWEKFRRAPEGSSRKAEAEKQLREVTSHRMHIDHSVKHIGKLLFGIEKGSKMLNSVRPAGLPVVDDWDCLKTLCEMSVRTFETHCGSLSEYGMKHMRSFANLCNAGIRKEQMAEASAQACVSIPDNPWSSLHAGFSA
ncbi:hypothetical protein RJT34_09541 [Clitoria ternatea]|uniref:Legumain prodomain domain-containing protein n=1 Tax=Clitoria ternatea TaxID=43366 RepID=A0AAN9K8Y0_CLITE